MSISRKHFLKSLAGTVAAGGMLAGLPLAMAEDRELAKPRKSKITDVEFFPFEPVQKAAQRTALGMVTAQSVLVRMRTSDGVTGWGESSPWAPVTGETQASNLAAGKILRPVFLDRSPFDIPQLVAAMDKSTAGQPGIKAALEMALWDLCGKIAGQPVRCLLGNFRDAYETDQTVYLGTIEASVERTKFILGSGIRSLKVKLGEKVEDDIAKMRAIREAAGPDTPIRIDANQGWSPADAIRALKGMEQYNIEFCEQPGVYWDLEGMKHVRDNSPIPIMADEAVRSPSDAIEIIRHGAADSFNIKMMKCGGILQAVKIAQIADAANMKCMLGCMNETRLALSAAAHVLCSQRNCVYADLDAFLDQKNDPYLGGFQLARGGIVQMPDAPGLGIEVDPAWLKTLRAA